MLLSGLTPQDHTFQLLLGQVGNKLGVPKGLVVAHVGVDARGVDQERLIFLLSKAFGQGMLAQLVGILGTEEAAEQGIDVGGLREVCSSTARPPYQAARDR